MPDPTPSHAAPGPADNPPARTHRARRAVRALDALRLALATVLLAGGAGASASLLLARHEGAVYQTLDAGLLDVEDLAGVTVPAVAALLGATALLVLGLWARGDRSTHRPLGPMLLPGVLDLGLLDAAAVAGAGLIHLRLRDTELADPTYTVLLAAVWALAVGLVLLPLRPTGAVSTEDSRPTARPVRRSRRAVAALAVAAVALAGAGAGAVTARATGLPPLLDIGDLETGPDPDPDLTNAVGPDGRWSLTSAGKVQDYTGSPSGIVMLLTRPTALSGGEQTRTASEGRVSVWNDRMAVVGVDPATGAVSWHRDLSLRTADTTNLDAIAAIHALTSESTGSLVVSPDGERVAIRLMPVAGTNAVVVLDTATGELIRSDEVTGDILAMTLTDDELVIQTSLHQVPPGGTITHLPLADEVRDHDPNTAQATSPGTTWVCEQWLSGATSDGILLADSYAVVANADQTGLNETPSALTVKRGNDTEPEEYAGVTSVLPHGRVVYEADGHQVLALLGEGTEEPVLIDVTDRRMYPVLVVDAGSATWATRVSGSVSAGDPWSSGTSLITADGEVTDIEPGSQEAPWRVVDTDGGIALERLGEDS